MQIPLSFRFQSVVPNSSISQRSMVVCCTSTRTLALMCRSDPSTANLLVVLRPSHCRAAWGALQSSYSQSKHFLCQHQTARCLIQSILSSNLCVWTGWWANFPKLSTATSSWSDGLSLSRTSPCLCLLLSLFQTFDPGWFRLWWGFRLKWKPNL